MKYVRDLVFRPRLAESWSALNAAIIKELETDRRVTATTGARSRKRDVGVAASAGDARLPARDPRVVTRVADKFGHVRVDTATYSVPIRDAYRPLRVKLYHDRVATAVGAGVIAEHPRAFCRGAKVLDALSTVIRNRTNLNRSSTATSWGRGLGIDKSQSGAGANRGAGRDAGGVGRAGGGGSLMAATIAEPPHLAADLKALRLSTVAAQWQPLAEQAVRQRQTPADYLAQSGASGGDRTPGALHPAPHPGRPLPGAEDAGRLLVRGAARPRPRRHPDLRLPPRRRGRQRRVRRRRWHRGRPICPSPWGWPAASTTTGCGS